MISREHTGRNRPRARTHALSQGHRAPGTVPSPSRDIPALRHESPRAGAVSSPPRARGRPRPGICRAPGQSRDGGSRAWESASHQSLPHPRSAAPIPPRTRPATRPASHPPHDVARCAPGRPRTRRRRARNARAPENREIAAKNRGCDAARRAQKPPRAPSASRDLGLRRAVHLPAPPGGPEGGGSRVTSPIFCTYRAFSVGPRLRPRGAAEIRALAPRGGAPARSRGSPVAEICRTRPAASSATSLRTATRRGERLPPLAGIARRRIRPAARRERCAEREGSRSRGSPSAAPARSRAAPVRYAVSRAALRHPNPSPRARADDLTRPPAALIAPGPATPTCATPGSALTPTRSIRRRCALRTGPRCTSSSDRSRPRDNRRR